MYCRVIGALRTNQDKKNVMVFRISEIGDMAEIDAHSLEVLYARMKIRQMKDKENASVYGNQKESSNDRLTNSMMGGFGASKIFQVYLMLKVDLLSTSCFELWDSYVLG